MRYVSYAIERNVKVSMRGFRKHYYYGFALVQDETSSSLGLAGWEVVAMGKIGASIESIVKDSAASFKPSGRTLFLDDPSTIIQHLDESVYRTLFRLVTGRDGNV